MYTSYQHSSWLKCACKSPSPCAMQHTQTQGIKAPLLARSCCFPATWPVASQGRPHFRARWKKRRAFSSSSRRDVRWIDEWCETSTQSQESQMTNSLSSRKPTWRIRQKSWRSWWFLAQWCGKTVPASLVGTSCKGGSVWNMAAFSLSLQPP